MTLLLRYREQSRSRGVAPRWLRNTTAAQLLYAIGLHFDMLREILVMGVKARFPGFHREATPILCRDRKMTRGPEETEEQIVARLISWRQSARAKGGVVALLRQLRAYLTPHNPRIRVVNDGGRYHELASDGTVTVGDQAWNWGGLAGPTRFWVLIWVPTTLWRSDGTFADPGVWGDGGVIGSTALPDVVAGIRALVNEWTNRWSRHMHTILIFDDAAWQAQQPDGTWGRVSRRNPGANYWPGER